MKRATLNRLKALGFPSYEAYLRSPEWAAVKRRLRKRRRCWMCGATERLVWHHAIYDRVGGDELPGDIVVLCSKHHRGLHLWARERRIPIRRAHVRYKASLKRRKLI